MKRLFYILTSLLVLSSCTDELSVSNEYNDVREGDNVKVQFSINAPDKGLVETRTLGEMTPAAQDALNVYLLVFDENGLFIQAAKATPGTNKEHGSHRDTPFTATLNATSAQRIIHFVAFDDDGETGGLSNQINQTINKFGTDVEKIANELYATAGQAAYWQRVVVSGIEEGKLKLPANYQDCVPLVRNFAKVSVAPKNGGVANFTFSGFTIINVPDKGTIAPYKGGFVEYVDVNNKVQKTYEAISALGYEGSAPAGTTYSTPVITTGQDGNESTIITTAPQYLYETPNASGDAKGRTSLIVKGRYNGKSGEKAGYYKVDLIYDNPQDEAAGHMFYNILRNFEYKVTINEVTGYGHGTFEEAVASAASNNLSASTTTANLSRISDGEQMLEVTNTYFMFTEAGVQTVLKYRYRYSADGGTTWITNNDLVKLTNSNDNLFKKGEDGTTVVGKPTITNTDDDNVEHWRTITMTLNDPTAQALTSNIHIYASKEAINGTAGNSIPASLKESILSGELLYRDVRVDLRNKYALKVVPQSYVPGNVDAKFRVDLLIPQSVNEGLFPMDFYLEDNNKYIYPDGTAKYIYPDGTTVTTMPVNIGPTIVDSSKKNSFQYVRSVTKAEFATLEKKTVDGVPYYVIPCYFKTNVANSDGTKIFASNEYFVEGFGTISNIPSAFPDAADLGLKIVDGTTPYAGQMYNTSDLYGKKNPATITFYVTKEAYDARSTTPFTLTITEGEGEGKVTTTPLVELSNANPVTVTDAGNKVTTTYYRQVFDYETKTTDGASITATVEAKMSGGEQESRNANLAMHRRYFVIAKNSFKTDIASHLPGGNTTDGSQIYVTDYYKPEFNGGTYVGWFGRGLSESSTGYLGNDGPLADYVIDRYYQGYTTLTDDMVVTFRIYNTDIKATTKIGVLDSARTNTDEAQKPYIEFKQD